MTANRPSAGPTEAEKASIIAACWHFIETVVDAVKVIEADEPPHPL